jgi:hypothetical protein
MSRRLWTDIPKGKHVFIFVNRIGFNLAIDKFTEKAVAHNLSSKLRSSSKGMRQCCTIHIFQLPAHGNPLGDSGRFYLSGLCHIVNVLRRRISLDSRIGSQDNLFDLALGETLSQMIESDLLRAYAIQWREMTTQYEITTPVVDGLFDDGLIGRGLHDAKLRWIPLRIGAQLA